MKCLMLPLTRIVFTNVRVVSDDCVFFFAYNSNAMIMMSLFMAKYVGGSPQKNKFHIPSANGCGSLGLGIPTEYLPAKEMSTCCDDHDICYDTCNRDKELCDLDFKRCLYNYCDSYEKSAVGGDIMMKGNSIK